jgi:undecaprenyl-diphosphatase
MLNWLLNLDTKLFVLLNAGPANPLFDVFFPFITEPRHWIVPLFVGGFFYYRKEKKKALILMGLALVSAGLSDVVCARLLKPLFERLRPCDPSILVPGGRFLLGQKTSFAFPSCHAANITTLTAFFFMHYPHRKRWFLVIAFLIGYSRIYCGVHYPLDVLGGTLAGCLIGGLAGKFSKRILND